MAKLMNNTGEVVDIFNLQKEDINSDVIILGACRINRFLGQTLYAYPVAAHLIGGYWYLDSISASDTIKKQWLIHEAFESYSGVDLPSPLKAELPLYKEAENKALKVIADAFGVNPVESDEIKKLDRSIMVAEALTIMPNSNYWINFAKDNNIETLSSAYVLREDQCNEGNLKQLLSEIWNDVFNSSLKEEKSETKIFLGKTQLNELLLELKLNFNESDNIMNIIKDLEEKGGGSEYLSCTDPDNQQVCIEINENVYIYSQQTKLFYSWDKDNERDVEDYFTETYDFSELTDEVIREGVSGFYNSLEALKKELPNDWKQIAIECIFEEQALGY